MLVFPPFLSKMKPLHYEHSSRPDTYVYTVIITVLCTATTFAILAFRPDSYGAWLLVTILVVTEVGHEDTFRHTVGRVIGILVGLVLAAVLVGLISSEIVAIGLGLVLMMIALVIRFGPHYWLYLAFLTPIEILISAGSAANVPITEVARLVYTVIGAALVLLASAIAILWARYRKTAGEGASP